VNDVHSPVSYLPTVLKCRGLEVACIPDRSKSADREEVQIYGAIRFAIYGPNLIQWQNRIRFISITSDVTGLEFLAEGEVQPYEQIENYRRRQIV
jgi:hypothetical protein